MPNHVTNTLCIYTDDGDNDALVKLLDDIRGDCEHIDFGTIIPMPGVTIESKDVKMTGEEMARNPNNWYDWSIANWGTKWNAYGQSIEQGFDGEAILTFDTAWSPPIPVIEALRKKYPKAAIYGSWLEEGHQSAGVF